MIERWKEAAKAGGISCTTLGLKAWQIFAILCSRKRFHDAQLTRFFSSIPSSYNVCITPRAGQIGKAIILLCVTVGYVMLCAVHWTLNVKQKQRVCVEDTSHWELDSPILFRAFCLATRWFWFADKTSVHKHLAAALEDILYKRFLESWLQR